MFEKRESYVMKGQRQVQEGYTKDAIKTIEEGLNYYQNNVIKAITPYPVADAALLVVMLKNMAHTIEVDNPDCIALVGDLEKKAKPPQSQIKTKFHKTKSRKKG